MCRFLSLPLVCHTFFFCLQGFSSASETPAQVESQRLTAGALSFKQEKAVSGSGEAQRQRMAARLMEETEAQSKKVQSLEKEQARGAEHFDSLLGNLRALRRKREEQAPQPPPLQPQPSSPNPSSPASIGRPPLVPALHLPERQTTMSPTTAVSPTAVLSMSRSGASLNTARSLGMSGSVPAYPDEIARNHRGWSSDDEPRSSSLSLSGNRYRCVPSGSPDTPCPSDYVTFAAHSPRFRHDPTAEAAAAAAQQQQRRRTRTPPSPRADKPSGGRAASPLGPAPTSPAAASRQHRRHRRSASPSHATNSPR